MLEEQIKEYTARIKSGEKPEEVFLEIELFYVIRQTLHSVDPGKVAGYTPNEYDNCALFFMNFLERHCDAALPVNANDIIDLAVTHISRHFGVCGGGEKSKEFGRSLFNELNSWQYDQILIKGKPLVLGDN